MLYNNIKLKKVNYLEKQLNTLQILIDKLLRKIRNNHTHTIAYYYKE